MTDGPDSATDILIIGHGLAGATLARSLQRRGRRVLVIDDATGGGASRVAAGLVTPVTGAKLKPQPDFDTLLDEARACYGDAARQAGRPLLMHRPALRLLTAPRELAAWDAADTALQRHMQRFDAALPAALQSAPVVTLMPAAARLDVTSFLDASRERLEAEGAWLSARVGSHDVMADDRGVSIPSLGVRGSRVIFCRGYADHDNHWFDALSWRPAKGQILTVRCGALTSSHTVHANGLWMTPDDDGQFLVGATYEWEALDTQITQEAREKLLAGLRRTLRATPEVAGQAAAVRPIVAGRMPVIGASVLDDRVFLFNGLGSKGALFAPTLARLLTNHLLDGAPVADRYSLQQRIQGGA